MTTPTAEPVHQLPETIRSYLAAREAQDVDRALDAFSPTAEVVDDGSTFRGTAGIRTFLRTAGAGFTYAARVLRVERAGDAVWTAHHRLEGDFPGGVVELALRFELSGGLITRLDITA